MSSPWKTAAEPPLAAMRPLVIAARLISNWGLRSLNHCWITRPSGKRGLIERNAATVKALAIAVSGVMKPASSMRSTAIRWPSGPTTAIDTGTPMAPAFSTTASMNSRHSAARSLAIPTPPAWPIKLHLTCYQRQLTAKKRVGEYRPGLSGREYGRAYLRTRLRARLAFGHAGRRSKLRRQLCSASLCLSRKQLGRHDPGGAYVPGPLCDHCISRHGADLGGPLPDAAHGQPADARCDQQHVARPMHVRRQ